MIAGQGTAAKEFFEEVGDLDYLLVPVGGGGLIAGSAIAGSHLSPNCRVIGVEPEAGNDVQQSFRTGKIVTIPVPQTIADGAQTTAAGKLTFPIIQKLVHDIVTVSDDQLREQMKFFAENEDYRRTHGLSWRSCPFKLPHQRNRQTRRRYH